MLPKVIRIIIRLFPKLKISAFLVLLLLRNITVTIQLSKNYVTIILLFFQPDAAMMEWKTSELLACN